MPLRDLFLEHLIYKLVLLYDGQARELGRLDLNGVHGPATATNVLHL
jgi:hypothetical protein